MTPPIKGKGKGKARAAKAAVDEDPHSDISLDSHDPALDESDLSGSEFFDSEDDEEEELASEEEDVEMPPPPRRKPPRKQEVASEEEFDDEDANSSDDEATMMQAAIEMSLQTSSPDVASSSSKKLVSANPAAILRAAAAERRLGLAKKGLNTVDDFGMEVDDDSDHNRPSDSENEVPLSRKRKAPSKGKSTKKAVTIRKTSKKHMTMPEMRLSRREERQRANAEKRESKKEEMALRKKLGRKLTAVRSTADFLKNETVLKTVLCFRPRRPRLICINIIQSLGTSGAIWKRIFPLSCQLNLSSLAT